MKIPFDRVGIKVKIIVPYIVATLVMIIAILVVVRHYTVKNQEEIIDDIVENKITEIQSNLTRVGKKALVAVSICSEMDAVKRAYKTYYETNDLKASSQIIRDQFTGINKSIETYTGKAAKFHFHLPPATSFIRCWTDKQGDDLSSFRKTILTISKQHKPIYGIETGRGGFVIRGLAPVNDENGNYLGSVEILFSISEIFKNTKVTAKEDFAAFIKQDLLSTATSLRDRAPSAANHNNFKTASFLLIESRTPNFQTSILDDAMLRAGLNEQVQYESGPFLVTTFPINNFEGEPEGVVVYSFDRTAFIETIQAINYSIIGSSLICAVFAIILVVFALNLTVLAPLSGMNRLLIETSNQSSSSSRQLSESSNMIAEGASRQAAAVEQTSASLEELSSMAVLTSERTQQCNSLSVQSDASMKQSHEAVQKLNSAVIKIVQATEETQKIVKTIDEIAFQTNLLALNAAVEAARAGEAGSGFAVVAEEVRSLAMKSAEAAKQTAALIEQSISSVKEVSSYVQKTNSSLDEVSGISAQINQLIMEIDQAAREQTEGVNQVNRAISDIDSVIQSNAASAEENSASANELSSQVQTVDEVVKQMEDFIGLDKKRNGY